VVEVLNEAADQQDEGECEVKSGFTAAMLIGLDVISGGGPRGCATAWRVWAGQYTHRLADFADCVENEMRHSERDVVADDEDKWRGTEEKGQVCFGDALQWRRRIRYRRFRYVDTQY
jgi:hypothetical protein